MFIKHGRDLVQGRHIADRRGFAHRELGERRILGRQHEIPDRRNPHQFPRPVEQVQVLHADHRIFLLVRTQVPDRVAHGRSRGIRNELCLHQPARGVRFVREQLRRVVPNADRQHGLDR